MEELGGNPVVVVHTGEVVFDRRNPVGGLTEEELTSRLSKALTDIQESGRTVASCFESQITIDSGDYGPGHERVIVVACGEAK